MAKKPPAPSETDATQFTVDIGQMELTDEEVNAFQNEITKLAVDWVKQKGSARRKKEPFVKIIFVRAIHN